MGSSIMRSVRDRFAAMAHDPASSKFPHGIESALALGYRVRDLDALPRACTARFAGVGNPLALAELVSGNVVLDVGCGAAVDSLLAANKVAPSGHVIGIDTTPEMIDAARRHAAESSIDNVTFLDSVADAIPVEDGNVDVVISNGLVNLCEDKARVLRELARVLRPSGRLQMADIILDEGVERATVERLGTWSD